MTPSTCRWRAAFALCVLACCSSCSSVLGPPTCTLPLPDPGPERARVFDDVGRRAFRVLTDGKPDPLLLDDDGLRALLVPEAASQAASLRAGTGLSMRVEPDDRAALAATRYLGICVQHAGLIGQGPPLGLRGSGFAFDRLLVVGVEPGGGRVAAWVEGSFVLTDRGFYAIALQRLESPRRDHADLDLAPCDFRFGLGSPRGVVVSGAGSY